MWVAVCDGACQPPYLEGKSANIFGFLRAMNGDILSPITSCTDALQTRKEIELIYDEPKEHLHRRVLEVIIPTVRKEM